jgi:hypothetical protein
MSKIEEHQSENGESNRIRKRKKGTSLSAF